jgi:hypothetical protein
MMVGWLAGEVDTSLLSSITLYAVLVVRNALLRIWAYSSLYLLQQFATWLSAYGAGANKIFEPLLWHTFMSYQAICFRNARFGAYRLDVTFTTWQKAEVNLRRAMDITLQYYQFVYDLTWAGSRLWE